MAPRVSVLVATYNRAACLTHAVRSALAQTVEDIEVIVVGDACTDDTAEALAALGDARVRFWNQPENHGDQSGPNNMAFQLSQAPVVAYLNHDDLWWPDHLERGLAALQDTGADGVYALIDSVHPDGSGHLHGATPDGRYHPWTSIPATGWVFTRDLVERVGGWRSAAELYNVPSQDVLFRAHQQGADLRSTGHLTAMVLMTKYRPGAYLDPGSHELQTLAAQMREDPEALRTRRLTALAHHAAAAETFAGPGAALGQLVRALGRRLASALGVHWIAFGKFFRHLRRGGHVDGLRRLRGLSPLGRQQGSGPTQ